MHILVLVYRRSISTVKLKQTLQNNFKKKETEKQNITKVIFPLYSNFLPNGEFFLSYLSYGVKIFQRLYLLYGCCLIILVPSRTRSQTC